MSRLKINIKGIENTGRTILLTIIAIAASWATMQAQQVIVNSNGDRIIMYPDGSWRPITPQDSVLLQQFLKTSGPDDPLLPSTTANPDRNTGEEQAYLLRRCQEIKLQILNQEKKVMNEFRAATNAQFTASELLRSAEANKEVLEPDRLTALKATYNNSVEQLRKAKLNQTAIRKLVGHAQVLSNKPDQITKRKLEQLQSRYQLYINHFEPAATLANNSAAQQKMEITTQKKWPSPDTNPPSKSTTESSPNREQKMREQPIPSVSKTAASKPMTYARKPYDCNPSLDSMDEATGRRHVILSPDIIFTHTDPDLRPFLKDRELITCRAWLWKIGPYVYLNVDFHISSSHSQQNFGSLAKGSLLRMKLLNEDFVSLYNLKTDRGRIDPYTGNTVFSSQYALGKEEITALRKSEIDKMRVLWGTGYEDYDVYNVDFFLDQLDCLMTH